MKKEVIGYIFNESRLRKDEEAFLKVAAKKRVDLVLINTAKEIKEDELEEMIKMCSLVFNNSGEDISIEVAKTIESCGKKVIDKPETLYGTEDKWLFYIKCRKHKIPTPETILLSENLRLARCELEEFGRWPVVLKRISGTMGEYVEKAENVNEAEKIILDFWRKGSERLPVVAQELIHSPCYRVLAVGGKIIQSLVKEARGWKATGVYAKNFRKIKADASLRHIVKKVLKMSGINICGIDLVKKDRKWMVLEVNSVPAFDFFEDEREKVIGQVLDFLKKKARE